MPLALPSSTIRPARAAALVVAALATLLGGCRPQRVEAVPTPEPTPEPPPATLLRAGPGEIGMNPALGRRIDSIARASIAAGTAPGMAIAVGRHGRLVHLQGYGTTDWAEGAPAVDSATIYDLASLTKVIATTTAAMMLEEEGRLVLDSTVAHYLPEFGQADSLKRAITVRMLLTHSGGLEAFAALHRDFRGREQYLQQIAARPLKGTPGDTTIYSDWDFILLGLVVERITGQTLDQFTQQRVFAPLGMHDTGFRPMISLRPRVAPTERDSLRGQIWGEVHDPNAWALGGVSGHAGLFGSARDLAVFAQMLLNGGSYGGVQLVTPQTLARWTAPQRRGSSRALGWDTPSPPASAGRHFSARSFGHTGFTGTSMWVDPERSLFVVILGNRVNSRGLSTTHIPLRRDVANAVQQAVLDAPLVTWERLPERTP